MTEESNRDLTRIGSMTPLELIMLAKYVGMEDLPFPFLGCYRHPFLKIEEYLAHQDEVISSYLAEEDKCVNHWFASFLHADIWVECRVPSNETSIKFYFQYDKSLRIFNESQHKGIFCIIILW